MTHPSDQDIINLISKQGWEYHVSYKDDNIITINLWHESPKPQVKKE